MHLSETAKKGYEFSFEIIPPRNGSSINDVYKIIDSIIEFKPAFISVTNGAGGSLRGGTAGIARLLKEHYNIEPLAHMTCATMTKESIENTLTDFKYLEIENILALRGDAPEGEPDYMPEEKMHASELVQQIDLMNKGYYIKRKNEMVGFELRQAEKTNFCIAVAGYPEGHRYCKDLKKDIEYLKRKVDAGASFIITQMVFDKNIFNNYVEMCRNAGIEIPIIPGIMPLRSINQIKMLESKFSVTIPAEMKLFMEKHANNEKSQYLEGILQTAFLMTELSETANGFHIYTMNKPDIVRETIGLYRKAINC